MKGKIHLLASGALLALSLTSCAPSSGPSINADKTQLYVGVYEGGLESGSYYKIAQEFEAKYAETSFEEGKMGVQVVFSEGRYSDPLSETIHGVSEEIFLDTAASALKFHSKDLILDISDLYESPMNYDFVRKETDSANPDSTLFKDKMRGDRLAYFQEDDGKYYGVPGYSQFFGIVYDIDMFNQYNLFFAKNGGFVTSSSDEKSPGPDGDPSTTYDNGLPATYDDFFALCDKIVSLDMTPIMWGGTVQEYVNSLLTALACDFDGKEQTELNYNFSGTANTLVSEVKADGTVVYKDPTAITASNGYELYSQAGRYYALSFLERLIANKKYYNSSDCTSLGLTNLDAQEQFLYSKYSSSRKRTAMLIEGSWWNKEAAGVFSAMAAEYGEQDGQSSRNIGLLPLPKATADKVGEKFTVLERAVGDGFIKSSIPSFKINLAKSFLQYLYQDSSSKTCLELDSQTRPVEFALSDAEYDALVPWSKTMYDLKKNAIVATCFSDSKMMRTYSSDLWYAPNLWNSTVSGATYTYPTYAMINNGVKALPYFEGLSTYMNKVVWSSKFSAAF